MVYISIKQIIMGGNIMKMKRILSFVLAFVLVASTINVGFAQSEIKTRLTILLRKATF